MTAPPHSLRRRLLFAVLGGSAIVWMVGLVVMNMLAWHIHQRTVDETLRETGKLIIAATTDFHQRGILPPSIRPTPPVTDDDRQTRRNHFQYQIVIDGEVISRSDNAPATPFVSTAASQQYFDIPTPHFVWRVFVIKNTGGNFEAQVAQIRPSLSRFLLTTGWRVLPPALLLLLLLGVLSWWAIRRLLAPLEETAAQLAQKSPHDLTPIPHSGLSEELLPVVDSLNHLLERLDRALHTERRFTADAAHELRTPLAALRVQTQLLARQHPQLAAPVEKLQRDIDRCTALIEQLLLLARLDPLNPDDVEALPRERLALAPLLGDVRRQCSSAAGPSQETAAQETTVTVHCDAALNINAHSEMLATALRNLLDNALRYGAEHVEIRAERKAGVVHIQIADDGPGVTADHYAQLTRRFFRLLGSGQPGSGLGLSIVQRIVELHGGTLEFGPGLEGRGLGVTLLLPQQIP